MSKRVSIEVKVELLSDTIFGSGYSVPGAEDIAVCVDESGYPFIKSTTIKGLLRESLANLICWTSSDCELISILLGSEGRGTAIGNRRLIFSQLELDERPVDAKACFVARAFTSMEDGVVKDGTLRVASCVRKGMCFVGRIYCASEDCEIVRTALSLIRYAGTMRSRGLGNIRVSSKIIESDNKAGEIGNGSCIRYRIRTESNMIMTDLGRSKRNSTETVRIINGAAVRGFVLNTLSENYPDEFERYRVQLLSDSCRFLDALPVNGDHVPLAPIMGFYADKNGDNFQTVLVDGNLDAGLKRVSYGSCCAIEDDALISWSTATDGVLRINISQGKEDDSNLFQTRYITKNQEFEGYICFDNPELAPLLAKAFDEIVILGADRYEGFGLCSVTSIETVPEKRQIAEYGIKEQSEITRDIYMLALSPFTMLNIAGEPCGIDEAELARMLGVSEVEVLVCSTSLVNRGGFNSRWKCRLPQIRMYDAGSIFHLVCSSAPDIDNIRRIENTGIGIRRNEGCGQLLFISEQRFNRIRSITNVNTVLEGEGDTVAIDRRKRQAWIMDNAEVINDMMRRYRLSKSQLGELQSVIENGIIRTPDDIFGEMHVFFEHNLNDRGPEHAEKFRWLSEFVEPIVNRDVNETLGTSSFIDSENIRAELICALIDFSRKGGE